MDNGAVGVDYEQGADRHASFVVENPVSAADLAVRPEVRQDKRCFSYSFFKVSGDPRQLNRYGVATYLEQFCTC